MDVSKDELAIIELALEIAIRNEEDEQSVDFPGVLEKVRQSMEQQES
jgi:hypothetical protein